MIKTIFISAFIISGVASAAPKTCKDLIFEKLDTFTCSFSGSDGSARSDVSIQFQASLNPFINIFESVATWDGQPVEYLCSCKSKGSVARPNFYSSKEVICNIKTPAFGAVNTFTGTVGGKAGAKLSKIHVYGTHPSAEPITYLGQCAR